MLKCLREIAQARLERIKLLVLAGHSTLHPVLERDYTVRPLHLARSQRGYCEEYQQAPTDPHGVVPDSVALVVRPLDFEPFSGPYGSQIRMDRALIGYWPSRTDYSLVRWLTMHREHATVFRRRNARRGAVLEPVSRHDLVNDVRLRLLHAILAGTLEPGEHLVEERMASRLGVSRAPVRDALKELEREGLVASSDKRGKVVVTLSAKDASEVYSLRATLEAMAIRLAIGRGGGQLVPQLEELVADMWRAVAADDHAACSALDVRFHEAVCRASGHELLLQAWEGMSARIRLLSQRVVSTQYQELAAIPTRHARLIELIRVGDPDAADRAIREHIDSVGAPVIAAMTKPASSVTSATPR